MASSTKVMSTGSQQEHELFNTPFFPPHCAITELNPSQFPTGEGRELSQNTASNQIVLMALLFKGTNADCKHQHTRLKQSPSFSTLKNAESSYGYMLSHLGTKPDSQDVHTGF